MADEKTCPWHKTPLDADGQCPEGKAEGVVTGLPGRQDVNITELFEDMKAWPREAKKKILAHALEGLGLLEDEIVDVLVQTKVTPELYNIYLGLKNSLK